MGLLGAYEALQEAVFYAREQGAVLAVDMAKAFDTVSSKFADAVYKFFGFGPVMQKWLSLLGTNRFACLILSLNSIFSTVLSPPENYWVGRCINYEKCGYRYVNA